MIADGVHDARTQGHRRRRRGRHGHGRRRSRPRPAAGRSPTTGRCPTSEDPDAPGLFAPGGCYLRKFSPHGTPCYYWGRLDKEWDLAHRQYGRRLMVNFADATGDLSRDGRSWTTVKDYAQWHEVARTIAGHIIDRYGADALDFHLERLQRARPGAALLAGRLERAARVLRLHDRRHPAGLRGPGTTTRSKVFIGGLELGGIFGTNLKLKEFLAHCSPRAEAQGRWPQNAAVADRRLDGKRSRRVEALCREHVGQGKPVRLHLDPLLQPLGADGRQADPGQGDGAGDRPGVLSGALGQLARGRAPTGCRRPTRRRPTLTWATAISRPGASTSCTASSSRPPATPATPYGETILTVWPPPANFAGINAVTRVLHVDDDGDGRSDRTVTVPMPIFHVLGLLSDLGDRYWVLPEQNGWRPHRSAASRRATIRASSGCLLYAHDARDTQSRSDATFDITLDLDGLGGSGPVIGAGISLRPRPQLALPAGPIAPRPARVGSTF